jgi:hypothetical protein
MPKFKKADIYPAAVSNAAMQAPPKTPEKI